MFVVAHFNVPVQSSERLASRMYRCPLPSRSPPSATYLTFVPRIRIVRQPLCSRCAYVSAGLSFPRRCRCVLLRLTHAEVNAQTAVALVAQPPRCWPTWNRIWQISQDGRRWYRRTACYDTYAMTYRTFLSFASALSFPVRRMLRETRFSGRYENGRDPPFY